MAIAFDAVSNTNTWSNEGGAKSVSLVLGGGSNRLVVVGISHYQAFTGGLTVQFNGVNMTLAVSKNNLGVSTRTYIYYILEAGLPATGTYNATVDPVDANVYGCLWALSLSGVKQSSPDAISDGGGNASSWQTAVTTLADNSWCVNLATVLASRTFTPDAGQTERFDFEEAVAGISVAGSTKPITPQGVSTLGWTLSPLTSALYLHALAAFAPFGAAVGASTMTGVQIITGVQTMTFG